LLLPVGLVLFLGEALFGSMGWGLLLAVELCFAIALASALRALKVPGVGPSLVIGLVVGVVFGVLFALSLPNEAWRRIADAVALTVGADRGATPLVVGTAIVGIVGAVVGLIAGARVNGAAAVGGLIGGLVLGALLGAFSSNTFGVGPGVATGIAIGLATWLVLMAIRLVSNGVDGEALKARFWPQVTIDTTKETIEWVRERTPLGPKS
jgi:hypothetical protein